MLRYCSILPFIFAALPLSANDQEPLAEVQKLALPELRSVTSIVLTKNGNGHIQLRSMRKVSRYFNEIRRRGCWPWTT
jgi:hypothetical protein